MQSKENKLIDRFKSEEPVQTKYESIIFLHNINDVKRFHLPIEKIEETQKRLHQNVSVDEKPLELTDVSRIRAREVTLTYKALDQWTELPGEVRGKIPKTLNQFIVNPKHPGLRRKNIKKGNSSFIRIRINGFYRIHLEQQADKILIREIGPHPLGRIR